MHICRLPYQPDGLTLFSHFAERPYAMFLDSCGKGRFDIIVANPDKTIITRNPSDDPFNLAKQQLLAQTAITWKNIPDEIPFTIGVMGYFSYDLGYHLAELTPQTTFDIDFPVSVVGFYHWSIVTDHQLRETYLISRDHPDTPELSAIQTLVSQLPLKVNPFYLTENFSSNMDKGQYTQAFNKVKLHIQAGDCYQINLAQRFRAAYKGSPWNAYQRLRHQIPMPMAGFINLADGAILCLSPERFLQVQNQQIITQPIKGTSPRFANLEQDHRSAQSLLTSEKDRAENMMIVDLLRNDLGKCCRPGTIKVPQLCELQSFVNVHHLVSTITGTLAEDQHPFDLLKHCFPGGSITGAPKRRAMEIIDNLELQHRSIYCGSIAYCDVRGRMDSNITIRTLLCSKDKIYCYGGGGIVYDSQLANEYQEIQTKISRLLDILETTADL